MSNKKRFVKVTVEMIMSIPAETDDEKLKAVLPDAIFEAFGIQIARPSDVEVLRVEETADPEFTK